VLFISSPPSGRVLRWLKGIGGGAGAGAGAGSAGASTGRTAQPPRVTERQLMVPRSSRGRAKATASKPNTQTTGQSRSITGLPPSNPIRVFYFVIAPERKSQRSRTTIASHENPIRKLTTAPSIERTCFMSRAGPSPGEKRDGHNRRCRASRSLFRPRLNGARSISARSPSNSGRMVATVATLTAGARGRTLGAERAADAND